MRSEGNPLDLNNLPEDGKLTSEDTSSSAGGSGSCYRKKKSGAAAKDAAVVVGKDHELGKVYECRFCSLKFCKSQALGGHMNRHRQERETETLNKARQLVFTNDLAPTHIGYVQGGQHGGGYHQGGGDPPLPPFRSMYPPRLFPSSSPLIPPPPPPPAQPQFMYASPPRVVSFHSPQYPPGNDYYVGHVLPNETNYTCIGAPVGHGFPGGGGSGRDVSLQNEEEWGRR